MIDTREEGIAEAHCRPLRRGSSIIQSSSTTQDQQIKETGVENIFFCALAALISLF